ncbi:MAG: 30S ribosomal protein S6 [Planctomycetes bacterium]|nr:30S ribosomal protein S6 [Planctomycetota bacterium]
MADNLYEAMFVVDARTSGSEFSEIIRKIVALLKRRGAEILRIEKWAEQKLAYRIQKAKRGTYILVYFRAEGSAIDELRRDVHLSEDLLRVLILRAEKQSEPVGELYTQEGEILGGTEEADAAGPEPAPQEAEREELETEEEDIEAAAPDADAEEEELEAEEAETQA